MNLNLKKKEREEIVNKAKLIFFFASYYLFFFPFSFVILFFICLNEIEIYPCRSKGNSYGKINGEKKVFFY